MPAKPRPAAKITVVGDNPAPSTSDKPTMLGDLVVQAVTIGTLWLLQEIYSPLLPGKEAPIRMKDVAAVVHILTEGQGAFNALQDGRDVFDREAMAAATRVSTADLGKVATILAGARPA